MSQTIEELAAALGISEKQLASLRMKYRRKHGKEAGAKLEAWLRRTEREMRDEDLFLRAGALPSDRGQKATNPRTTALGRGRTGRRREPGEARRRHHKKVTKPPTPSQIEEAAEDSAYVTFGDSLDAGAVPRDYQNVVSMQGRVHDAERRQEQVEVRTKEDASQVAKQLREVALGIARSGGDSVGFLAEIQRQVAAKRDEMRDAA